MSGFGWKALALAGVLMLSGCAAQRAFNEGQALLDQGQTAEGLARMEEAVKLDPGNTRYRMGLVSRRTGAVQLLLARAELARSQNRLAEAEGLYRQVLSVEPQNAKAALGVDGLATERRHRQAVQEAEARLRKNELQEAAELLRPVLAENPNQRDALNLQARIAEKRQQAPTAEVRLAERFRKPISLEFRDAALRSVFDVISKVSGISFFFDKDIRPDLKANIVARNTTVEDAVRLLLVTNQLEQKVLADNAILIYPNNPQKLKDYQNLSVRSFFLANAEAKQVATTLKTILKTRDMVVNEKLNLIILRDTPEALRLAEKLVALEDVGEAEVMLEVEVMEIKRTRLMELGVRWPEQLTLSVLGEGEGSNVTLQTLRRLGPEGVGATLSNMVVNAKKEDSDSNILANPRIRVRNKEKAKILIGDRVPVITTTSTATGFVSDSVNYVDVGLKLEVEPNIYLDDEVAIKVNLEVSSLVREVLSRSGTLSYQIGTRNATTVLKLKDGETQILAGLINDEDRHAANRVPGVGELPILGRLFGSHKDDRQKTEIVLTITPRVIRNIRRPDLMTAEFDSGTESAAGSRPLILSPAEEPEAKPQAVMAKAAGELAAAPAKTQASAPGLTLKWQGPSRLKAGEQFSTVLRLESQPAFSGLPLLIGFDPAVLQVVSVVEGDFLRQAGGQTHFSSRVDPQAGRIFVAAVRQGGTINGVGNILTVNFKAVKAAERTGVQLLSLTPEPSTESPLLLPIEHSASIANP